MAVKESYFEDRPSPQSVKLGKRYVNISALSRGLNRDHGYLSRILSGHRTPSVPFLLEIANALDLTMDELLLLISERAAQLKASA